MTTVRTETERIEITRGPTVNHPGDLYRVFIPGLTRYFVDDVEVSEAEYAAAESSGRLTEGDSQ